MGKSKFQRKWLSHENYKEWLSVAPSGSDFKAYCKLCRKEFDVTCMGEGALKSHARGSKHLSYTKASSCVQHLDSFVKVHDPSGLPSTHTTKTVGDAEVQASTSASGRNDAGKLNVVSLDEQWTAEVIWAMKVVASHYSYNSCTDIQNVFQKMFPDSRIVQNFSCGEKKCAYVVCYGLAPYFKATLLEQIQGLSDYVILFDESMNQYTNNKQMDYHIRFYDDVAKQVVTRYYTSAFLGHATARIMVDEFLHTFRKFKLGNLVQISMDGPSVNWAFLDLLTKSITVEDSQRLVDIGSCGLHTVHNSLKRGFESWPVKEFLNALSKLMSDTPARRSDFVEITGSSLFALQFCAHRWVENANVVKRALVVFNNFQTYVETVQKPDKKYSVPNTKSFEVVKKGTADILMKSRLHFFQSVSEDYEFFLRAYETDRPMTPFLANDLTTLLHRLMARFIKDDLLDDVTPTQLIQIDIEQYENQVSHEKVDVGISCAKCLKDLKKSGKISELEIMRFKKECVKCLKACVQALVNKCPLKYSLTRNLVCLDPRRLVDKQKMKENRQTFRLILEKLANLKQINESDCHVLEQQFKSFLENEVVVNFSKFEEFKPHEDRLDTLYSDLLSCKSDYSKLWKLIKKLLVLSHGQATVERGFSINKQLIVENLKEDSIIAQRVVYDGIQAAGGLLSVPITKNMLAYARSARQKYVLALKEKKEENSFTTAATTEKDTKDALDKLRRKRQRIESDAKSLDIAADELAEKAERLGDMLLLTKSNSFRKSSKCKKIEMEDLDKKILDLQKTRGRQ